MNLKLLTLISLLFAMKSYTFAERNETFVEYLKKLSGLRFTAIGDLKLIVEQREVNFVIGLNAIRTLIDKVKSDLEKVEKFDQNDLDYGAKLNTVKKIIDTMENDLNDLSFESSSLIAKEHNHTIVKRSETILKEKINEVIKRVNQHNVNFEKSVQSQKRTTLEIEKERELNDLRAALYVIESKLESIHSIQTKNRLSKSIVSIADLQKELDKIKQTLGPDRELPYKSQNEYFYNLKVTQKMQNDTLTLKINIPIVQKIKRKLYLIEEFPTYYNDSLQVTDVKWKYLAVSENNPEDSVTLKDLDQCIAPINSTYLCESQAPLIRLEESNDCATNSLMNGITDIENCNLRVFEVNNSLYIKLNDGHFFFYAHNEEEVTMKCNGFEKPLTLAASSTGILKVRVGCMAMTDKYTLIGKSRYVQDTVFLSIYIGYDVDKLLYEIEHSISPLYTKFYLESLEDLRQIYDVKLPLIEYYNGPTESSITNVLAAVVIICVIMFTMKIYCRRQLNKKMNTKAEQN